ncbi:MAG: HNH endonuclease [Candidatus Lutacidiplasmatales archaeon]
MAISGPSGTALPASLAPGSYISYKELSRTHPHHQGIATQVGVAYSIVCDPSGAGPYSDRWLREGAILDYCGQGRGRDQEWNRYNISLRVAMEEGRRVHVFEDLEETPARYLYHGQWSVLSYHEAADPETGLRQFRFILSAEPLRLRPQPGGPITEEGEAAVDTSEPPARALATTNRIIRDTRLSRKLKAEYGNRCQVCGRVQRISASRSYSEGHHLRPLGRPHDGPDVRSNIVVLCAAHHVEFDYGAIAIDPADGVTILAPFDPAIAGKTLTLRPRHRLDPASIRYHVDRIFVGEAGAIASPGPGALSSRELQVDGREAR